MTAEPIWLLRCAIEQIHAEQIAEHGGAWGVRSPELLESALARARNQHVYGKPDIFDLAATYAYGIARNHPFVDGNKRTAFLAGYVFLRLNGVRLSVSQTDAVHSVLSLAAGTLSEIGFAQWLRTISHPDPTHLDR